jgi:AcrR family transcriptional regulator
MADASDNQRQRGDSETHDPGASGGVPSRRRTQRTAKSNGSDATGQLGTSRLNDVESLSAGSQAKGRPDERPPRPSGREEVIDAIIGATLELCVEGGPHGVSLRRVAERANVNYGLVHRHFGTRTAVLRAAMEMAHKRSYERVAPTTDIGMAIDQILYAGSGTLSKMLAWGILQGEAETVLPTESLSLRRLSELALRERDATSAEESLDTRVRVGTVVAALLGWRLYEQYLTRGLGLDYLSRAELYKLIGPGLIEFITMPIGVASEVSN